MLIFTMLDHLNLPGLFTLKIKGKITHAHNFIHLYNDKIFYIFINIQSFIKQQNIKF